MCHTGIPRAVKRVGDHRAIARLVHATTRSSTRKRWQPRRSGRLASDMSSFPASAVYLRHPRKDTRNTG
jgi:hypothetical protein